MAQTKVKQTVLISEDENSVAVRVNLVAILTEAEEGGYNCYCPALKISSQGDNLKQARDNIIEATSLFIESCVARHCLSEALTRRGFAKVINRKQRRQSGLKLNKKHKIIEFPVKIPLAA